MHCTFDPFDLQTAAQTKRKEIKEKKQRCYRETNNKSWNGIKMWIISREGILNVGDVRGICFIQCTTLTWSGELDEVLWNPLGPRLWPKGLASRACQNLCLSPSQTPTGLEVGLTSTPDANFTQVVETSCNVLTTQVFLSCKLEALPFFGPLCNPCMHVDVRSLLKVSELKAHAIVLRLSFPSRGVKETVKTFYYV